MQNYDTLKKISLDKGYKWFDEPLKLNIIGIRTNLCIPNVYNDIMCVCRIDDKGVKNVFSYNQTTLPGKFWLNNPSNPKGCAILPEGQYIDKWIRGIHGKSRPHAALIQRGGPLDIIRDNDKDDLAELTGPNCVLEKGVWIGLNIHASWAIGDRKYIDKDSAGCQVSANAWHHEQLMLRVNDYEKKVLGFIPTYEQMEKNPKYQVKFSYTLLNEKDLK
jgi:hypothetical protein